MPHEDGSLAIGDFSRDGLLQLVDTHWDSNGTLTVSVREMVGGFDSWIIGKPGVIRKMRRFAKRALPEYYPGQTKHCRLIRTYDFGGCDAATFAVSRIP